MVTKQLTMRHYHIVDHSGPVDACAQFMYKDFMISMSTMGISKGACQHEVEIYHKNNLSKPVGNGLHTVEEAINEVNKLEVLRLQQLQDQVEGLCELLVKSEVLKK